MTGGNDNVVFHASVADGNLGITGNANYTILLGFNVANDIFTIDASTVAAALQVTLQETNGSAVFNPPGIANYNTGTIGVNLAGGFTDMIKVDGAVGGGGLTAQTLFNASMGATGSIIVATAANDILFAAYNNDTQQAVIMVVHADTTGPANVINSGDDVDVLAQIGNVFH